MWSSDIPDEEAQPIVWSEDPTHSVEAESFVGGHTWESDDNVKMLHKTLDMDGDGRVTLGEMMQHAQSLRHHMAHRNTDTIMFEVDEDGDRSLSLAEYLNDVASQANMTRHRSNEELHQLKQLGTRKFHAADMDRNGFVSMTEIPELFHPDEDSPVMDVEAAETFRLKDIDLDGRLSAKDFWEEPPRMKGAEFDAADEQEDFDLLDKNKDGYLDVQEIRPWLAGHFHSQAAMRHLLKVADEDGDGAIELSELMDAKDDIGRSGRSYHLREWFEAQF